MLNDVICILYITTSINLRDFVILDISSTEINLTELKKVKLKCLHFLKANSCEKMFTLPLVSPNELYAREQFEP